VRPTLRNKVDKIEGMGLSKNDFTDNLKQKLEDLKEEIDVNVKNVITTSVISKNTNYTVPSYVVGKNLLLVFFEGSKLIKDKEYIEIGTEGEKSTIIQFKDWDVPIGSNLEFLYN